MWFLVVAMLVILVLAGLVVLYVAFPHRGEEVPHVPWVGRLMRRGVDSAPTLDNTADPASGAAGLAAAGSHAGEADGSSLVHDLAALDRERPEDRRRGA
jgi:hypothetical protein